MVSQGHVALDGTNVQANASKHKAMSHGRMLRAEQQLETEINALMRRAEILDGQEDQRYGKAKLGSELPVELRYKQSRLKKVLQARKAVEAETASAAARAMDALEKATENAGSAGVEPLDLGILATNRCHAVGWPAKPTAHPQRRRNPTLRIPRAISCCQVSPSCRATTASWLSIATTR